jgi:RNA polymerase sigma factor (sigma-70 family)
VNIVPAPNLIRRCIEREPAAWTELLQRHRLLVLRVLVRTVGATDASAAEDLEQEVWGRLLANECDALWGLVDADEGNLRAFLYRTALNIGRDHLRRLSIRRVAHAGPVEELAESIADEGEGIEASYERHERRQIILDALDEVLTPPNDERDRMIFRAHYLDGLTAGEIAAMGIGLAPKGVESMLHRLLSRVKALLRSREDAA